MNSSRTGLGLSLIKKLIEIMGGSITVESEYGVGTTLTLSLNIANIIPNESFMVIPEEPSLRHSPKFNPLVVHRLEKMALLQSSSTLLKAHSKLIVDDNVYNLYALKTMLASLELV